MFAALENLNDDDDDDFDHDNVDISMVLESIRLRNKRREYMKEKLMSLKQTVTTKV
jgi:hypothetical protein